MFTTSAPGVLAVSKTKAGHEDHRAEYILCMGQRILTISGKIIRHDAPEFACVHRSECLIDHTSETIYNTFADLVPPVLRTDERTNRALEISVHRLVLTSLAVAISVALCVPYFWRDEWATTS